MHYRIGNVRPHEESEVKYIRDPQDTRALQSGDVVNSFDHVYEWDEDCVTIEMCERWRQLGDSSCDRALREVFSSPTTSVGKDLLKTLQDYAVSASSVETVHEFLQEVHHPPPAGILASEEEVTLAQEFFLDNSIQIMQALLHYSLAGGFASPRIVRTLEAVSYLVPHVRHTPHDTALPELADILANITKASTDRTFSRLVETFQFVLEVMGCGSQLPAPGQQGTDPAPTTTVSYLLPGGDGWRSAVRVRLLHGVARWRAEERWSKEGSADVGVPVSQEDMGATLAAFSTIPIWCLHRLGLPPAPAQASAYLALWRHVGYYLGVSPQILLRHFRDTRTADKFLVTTALHLFSDDLSPPSSPFLSPPPPSSSSSRTDSDSARRGTILRGPTIPILVAVSNRPPLHTSLEYNIALTTYLLGPALAAHLGLPPTSLRTRLRMHALLLIQRVSHVFARLYPRAGWREARRTVLREGMIRSVWWNLGLRRTTFRPRTTVRDVDGVEGEACASAGGDIAPGVVEEESIRRDPARARVLQKMWKEVWMEMVGVSAVAGLAAIAVAYISYTALGRNVHSVLAVD